MSVSDLPSQFYWIVGVLFVFNIGTVISVLVGAGRIVWFISKLDSNVKEAVEDINGFGGRVKKVEEMHHSFDKRISLLEHDADE